MSASEWPFEGQDPVFGVRRGSAAITWFHRNPALSNQHCLYCGAFVGVGSEIESDKEHLIARRLIPRGLMQGPNAFNLIFRACCLCNSEKARIEDRISAVTLLTSPGRDDPAVDAEALRKAAASFDARHRKPVLEVRNDMRLNFGDMISMTMTSPAQLDRRDIHELAFRHIQGLFALITSRDPRRSDQMRLLIPEHFGVFGSWPYRDWGSTPLLEISRRAYGLPRLAEITSADGFFRAALRRERPGVPWFWALEWNQNLRVTGWIGDRRASLFEDLPELGWKPMGEGWRMREEIALPETAEDLLFDPVTSPPLGSSPPPRR